MGIREKLDGMQEPLVYFGLTAFFLLFAALVVGLDIMTNKTLPVRLNDATVVIGAICVVGALFAFHLANKSIETKDKETETPAPSVEENGMTPGVAAIAEPPAETAQKT